MNIVSVADIGINAAERLLKKKAFDELTLNDRIRQSNVEIFGEDLSPIDLVHRIVQDVRYKGDEALFHYTKLLDHVDLTPKNLMVSEEEFQAAERSVNPDVVASLKKAADNIFSYHEEQKPRSWMTYRAHGSILGQEVLPLSRVGIYVPGGTAAYPSSVLMNAIPAKVAGVGELIMVVPTPGGERTPLVLAAAALAGVDRMFTIGGAQAIGALAYGTETVPRVDKIVGPGNAYVAAAKRRVFGRVGIDMVAGPSEILIVCDGQTDPDWIAMDLFSQAEHDELAQAMLLCPDLGYLDRVAASIERLLPAMPRRDTIFAALENRGALIAVRDLEEACELVNRIAPEHLELALTDADIWVDRIRHAGAIFIGSYACEALGDYCAGPNHVLPTSGSARFSSPLGVYDFQKRSSLIRVSPAAARTLGAVAATLADGEGLAAHAASARYRVKG